MKKLFTIMVLLSCLTFSIHTADQERVFDPQAAFGLAGGFVGGYVGMNFSKIVWRHSMPKALCLMCGSLFGHIYGQSLYFVLFRPKPVKGEPRYQYYLNMMTKKNMSIATCACALGLLGYAIYKKNKHDKNESNLTPSEKN